VTERFRAKDAPDAVTPKLDPTSEILDDLDQLAADAADIVLEGKHAFLADSASGRRLRHAGDGILIKVAELCERLPDEVRLRHSDIQFHEIKGLRNRLGHRYRATSPAIVWSTLDESIPDLVGKLASER
jgi:uncharacterized protein with HEPN domain